eukprot:TRINITY_DN43780_c0_g1_i1.p1 TRINITY_DN43780_c0_g1~~TRINITY_DN43780_c0_g1_i1.p1  ORF type:complete len:832 (-),score=195.94 TRINITY_DN43780_c0_g1_i1:81-2576(-)
MVLIDGKASVKRSQVREPGANGSRVEEGLEAGVGPPTAAMLGLQGGMGPFGVGLNAAAMGGASMGNFDFFAHMAAAARMQAAMFRAMQGEDEEEEEAPAKRAKLEDEGPAFDKDALQRLAKQAAERREEQSQQHMPPSLGLNMSHGGGSASCVGVHGGATSGDVAKVAAVWGPAGAGAGMHAVPPCYEVAAPSPSPAVSPSHPAAVLPARPEASISRQPEQTPPEEQARGSEKKRFDEPSPEPSTRAPPPEDEVRSNIQPTQASAPGSETSQDPALVQAPETRERKKDIGQLQSLEPREKKKDATSVASLLQQVQSNVARGRAVGAKTQEPPVTVQSFTIGGGGGSSASAGPCPGRIQTASSGCTLLDAISRRLEDGSVFGESRKAVENEILDMLPNLEPLRAVDLLMRVYTCEALKTVEFLENIIQVLMPVLAKFNSPHLTRVLSTTATWAVATCGGEEDMKLSKLSDCIKDFFTACATELSLRLMDVVPRDLAQIATALSSVGHIDARLYGSLARAAVARSERFTPQEIVALGVAFDKAGFVHTALFEIVAKVMRINVKEISHRELLKGIIALAKAGIRDEDLGQVVGEMLAKKALLDNMEGPYEDPNFFSADELCAMAWAFCTLGLYHDDMFRGVFRSMEDAAVVPGETLCQLYEIHVMLVGLRHDLYKPYELPADTVHSLREHYKKHRGGRMRDYRLDRATEKLHKDVAAALVRVFDSSTQAQYQTTIGFAADVAALKGKANSEVAVLIEIDGPHTLVQSLDPQGSLQVTQNFRVRGDVLLKRRVMQQNGFHMAVFSEETWRSLEDGREKREFLRELLRHAGVSCGK